MAALLALAAEGLLSLLAPPRCAACDAPVRWLAAFCEPCAVSVVRFAAGPELPPAALLYGGAVAKAIGRMKYEGRPDLARPLADLLWRALQPHARSLHGVCVVPVPLHTSRLVDRGFNQSALIAGRLASRLGTSFRPGVLVRARATQQQAALDRFARVENVAGAFRARPRVLVRGERVLLVDDVTTTGATLDSCERALIAVGVTRVLRVAVASAPQRVEGAMRDWEARRRPWGYHASHP
jgi:ComF family protein